MARKVTGLLPAFGRTHAAKGAAGRPGVWLSPNAAGSGAADYLVLIGDQFGRVIGEMQGEVQGVAWKLNDYGQARFTLGRADAAATEEMLRPGNRVLVQFGNGLPDWGGMLDLPLRFRSGRIELTAYSGERILADRITGRGRYFSNMTAGEIFRALLNEAAPSGVEVGDVWTGGELHGPDYHYRQLYDVYSRSLSGRIEDADWGVSARLASGRIAFRANFYERRGVDHGRRLALIDGVNMAEGDLNYQGTLVNEWSFAGAGTGWGESNRIYAGARDEASIAKYGLRQRGETRVDVSVQETLDRSAAVALAGSREPRGIIDPVALDRAPARFWQYDVGDRIRVEMYEVGFGDGYEATVRVTAREFLPATGVCSLVVE